MINQDTAFNPYDFTNPVSDISLLVGREKEMEEIKYYLDNAKNAPRPTNIAILGQRASGKTSILNIAEEEAKKRGFCTVRVDLDEGNVTSELAFFSNYSILFSKMLVQVVRLKVLMAKPMILILTLSVLILYLKIKLFAHLYSLFNLQKL